MKRILIAGLSCGVVVSVVHAGEPSAGESLLPLATFSWQDTGTTVDLGEDSEGNSWYMTMGGGISLLSDVGQDDENLPLGGGFTLVTSGVSYGFDVGPALDIGIGVEIADDFRLQFDLGYTQNDIDTFSGSATILDPAGALFGVVFGTDGEVDQLSLMASAIYEFGDDDSNVRPYVGAGIGGARVSSTLNVTYVDILGNNVSATYETDEWGVAFQGLAGIEFDLSPTSSMTVGYRFLRSDYYSDMDAFNNHSVQAAISFQF